MLHVCMCITTTQTMKTVNKVSPQATMYIHVKQETCYHAVVVYDKNSTKLHVQ